MDSGSLPSMPSRERYRGQLTWVACKGIGPTPGVLLATSLAKNTAKTTGHACPVVVRVPFHGTKPLYGAASQKGRRHKVDTAAKKRGPTSNFHRSRPIEALQMFSMQAITTRKMRRFSSEIPASGLSEIALLDEELYRLARGAGRLRLRIGQALHRLGDGVHELGFSTLGAYALERCCRGGRWAAESRTLARRLQSLPQLEKAIEAGSIGWSMAELLARHATPQTEAALLQVARGKTVQAMRIALSPQDSPDSAEPPDDDELARTLSLTLPVEEAWALEATRMMVEHMDGKCTGGHFLESLLAEGTISLLELVDPSENDVWVQMEAKQTAWRAQMQRLQHLHADAELRSHPAVATEPHPGEAPDADDLPLGLEALDARIRHYSAELASRDLFFGRMAQRFLALRGWQMLGFVSEAHYARERLGMSRAALRSKLSLARRSRGLDHVVDALQQGRIGFEAAQLVARIATADTERAWVERATRRTFKHLHEEVQAVEMATRFAGQTDRSPPSEDHIAEVQALERAILSGELLRKVIRNLASEPYEPSEREEALTVQISGSPDDEAPNEAVQISGSPGGKVTLRMRVPGDLLLWYRQLERIHRQRMPGTSFIQFLCASFWQTWVPTLGVSDKWETIYRRDRYRCTSPVCHQRNVTLHHVAYRAHGGSDDPDNLTCPCAFCHLQGEHGGRLKILPPGSDPTWILGRQPIMRVHRRERTLLA
jgi:hypothetical protein